MKLNSQIPNPKSQLPNPKSQITTSKSQIPSPNAQRPNSAAKSSIEVKGRGSSAVPGRGTRRASMYGPYELEFIETLRSP